MLATGNPEPKWWLTRVHRIIEGKVWTGFFSLETMAEAELVERCRELQEQEIEMVHAMYPPEDELDRDGHQNLAVTIRVDHGVELRVEICLPRTYPLGGERPFIFVRQEDSDSTWQLEDGQSEQSLNQHLSSYVASLPAKELCLYLALSWLEENAKSYLTPMPAVVVDQPVEAISCKKKVHPVAMDCPLCYGCFWIHSHHIYNTQKRRHILSLSRQMGLSGFCLPGKPGIICVEGDHSSCSLWWQQIKSMTWKKIALRIEERVEVAAGQLDSLRKFSGFHELNLEGAGGGGGRNYHMDMKKFMEFLQEHNSQQVFKDLFGFEPSASS